jgi:hypothetical protein
LAAPEPSLVANLELVGREWYVKREAKPERSSSVFAPIEEYIT